MEAKYKYGDTVLFVISARYYPHEYKLYSGRISSVDDDYDINSVSYQIDVAIDDGYDSDTYDVLESAILTKFIIKGDDNVY